MSGAVTPHKLEDPKEGRARMATPDLRRLAEYLDGLPDHLLLYEYGLGPAAFAHPAGWELLVAEVQRRGLKSTQDVAEDLAAIETDPELANTLLFCEDCLAATTPDSAGDSHLVSLFHITVGDKLIGHSDECPACSSYVARL